MSISAMKLPLEKPTAFVLMLFTVVAVCRGQKPTPMSLTVSGDTEIKLGLNVTVKVTVTNVSDHIIRFNETSTECNYPVEVRDIQGNLLPETPHRIELVGCGQRMHVVGRNILVTLRPHESWTAGYLEVSNLFEVKAAGRYSIQVTRKIPMEYGGGVVNSNVFFVTITD